MKKVLFFICVALCYSWATFAQTEAPDSVQLTEDVQPPVVSYGSISYTNTYVALNTASLAYDWAVGKQVTVGGQVGIGIWLNSLLGGDSFIMNPGGFLQVRTRWYFDRPYRQRRGYSLRYNSGFFGELALTNYLYVDLPIYNGIGTMNCATLTLTPGFRYVFPNRLELEAKLGVMGAFAYGAAGVFPIIIAAMPLAAFVFPYAEVKIGYAF